MVVILVPTETLLPVLQLARNVLTVKKQTLPDPIVQHVMMVLKQQQAGIIAHDVLMVLSLLMLLTQIAQHAPVALKLWLIDQIVHCNYILTIVVLMVLKQMQLEVTATAVCIQSKLL